jgi:hypothetical protein
VKNVFSDCQFWEDDVVLGDIANDLLVPEYIVSFANGTAALPNIDSGRLKNEAGKSCNILLSRREIIREMQSYFEIFPATPLTFVTPPVWDCFPIRTFTKVAANN